METERVFVMLDPATDNILAVCAGPSQEGKCPQADTPPYVCQGLHLIGTRGTLEGVSYTVDEMAPGRCPLARVAEAVDPPDSR